MRATDLELVDFRPYGRADIDSARALALASIERTMPMLAPNPPNGRHVLALQCHPETAVPWRGASWTYGPCYSSHWKVEVGARYVYRPAPTGGAS